MDSRTFAITTKACFFIGTGSVLVIDAIPELKTIFGIVAITAGTVSAAAYFANQRKFKK